MSVVSDGTLDYRQVRDYLHRETDSQVQSVVVYDNGNALVVRNGSGEAPGGGGTRGEISQLTAKARSKMLFTLSTTSVVFRSMLTITYGVQYPLCGRQVKSDLDRLLKALRRHGVGEYFWFLEFQLRGAPHVHIMLEAPEPHGQREREWLASAWVRASRCPDVMYSSLRTRKETNSIEALASVHCHNKSWENIREEQGAVRYVTKYALKTRQKVVPQQYRNVGRFWGASRGVKEKKRECIEAEMTGEELGALLWTTGHSMADSEVIPKYIFGLGERTGKGRIEEVERELVQDEPMSPAQMRELAIQRKIWGEGASVDTRGDKEYNQSGPDWPTTDAHQRSVRKQPACEAGRVPRSS